MLLIFFSRVWFERIQTGFTAIVFCLLSSILTRQTLEHSKSSKSTSFHYSNVKIVLVFSISKVSNTNFVYLNNMEKTIQKWKIQPTIGKLSVVLPVLRSGCWIIEELLKKYKNLRKTIQNQNTTNTKFLIKNESGCFFKTKRNTKHSVYFMFVQRMQFQILFNEIH